MPPGPVRRLCSTVFCSLTVVFRVVRFVVTVWPSVFVLLLSLNVECVDALAAGNAPGPSSRAADGAGSASGGAALTDGPAAGRGGKLDKSAAVALDSVNGAADESVFRVPKKKAAPRTAASN